MISSSWRVALAAAALGLGSVWAQAGETECGNTALPRISFVQFTSPNIATSPPSLLTIKGKLSLPQQRDHHKPEHEALRDGVKSHGLLSSAVCSKRTHSSRKR